MDLDLKNDFLRKWEKYFGIAALPLVYFYTDDPRNATLVSNTKGWSCIICELAKVRNGESLAYDEPGLRCGGSKRYLGYAEGMRPNFEYFLSCGIPGKMEGERYIRTPEMVREMMQQMENIPAGGKYIVFKRWDKLEEDDDPEAVIFFASPDVLSGLFTLANFDEVNGDGVIAPFGSGCGSIIYRTYQQRDHEHPKAVLGMFDCSARPCVPKETLSFSIPMKKFINMVRYTDESFLITKTWETVRTRINPGGPQDVS
jgi:uncharacterized protein (DUF169 family)